MPLLVGSVKSNIGHTESAAGTAGLLKILLMMKNGLFVPSVHVRSDKSNLNPDIKLSEFGLEISSHAKEWPSSINGERHACLNSFGFGGSNVHIIITQRNTTLSKVREISKESNFTPICISGVDKESLKLNLLHFDDNLSGSLRPLSHISQTSISHRDIFPYRTIVFGKSKMDIQNEIKNKLRHIDKIHPHKKHKKIFVYCGVGTTWTGMCREFMQLSSVFRKTIDKIDAYLEPLTGWKMGEKFVAITSYDDPFLNHIAIFCCQVGLTEVWKSFGIIPDIVIGQSVGEVAAAYAAKLLTLEESVNVIYHRSDVLSRQCEGTMAVVGNLDIKEVANMCSRYGSNVCIAVYSSPTACTISGSTSEVHRFIDDIRKNFDNKDIFIRQLKVKCAYHSPLLDCCLEEITARIDQYFINKQKEIETCFDTIPMLSTVTGTYVVHGETKTGDYWARNIREPVMFMQNVKQSFDEKRLNAYIEIGPRPVLRTHLPKIMENNRMASPILSMKQDMELKCFYGSISELFEHGIDLNNSSLNNSSDYEVTEIPKYRFKRNGDLYIPNSLKDYLAGCFNENNNDHMFIQVSKYRDDVKFAICINETSTPFVYDHFLFGDIIVPGATYVEAGFYVGKKILQKPVDQLSVALNFKKTFTPEHRQQHKINIQFKSEDNDYLSFNVLDDGNLLAIGTVSERKTPKRLSFDIDYLRRLCPLHISKMECYSALECFKFQYGESLRLIQRAWISNSRSRCLTEIRLSESTYKSVHRTSFHPAVIDSVFQTFGVLASRPSAETLSLPKGVNNVVVNKPVEKIMFSYVEEVKTNGHSTFYNAVLLSETGTVIAEIDNFYTKTLSVNSRLVDKSYEFTLNWAEVLDFSENRFLDGNILLYTNDNCGNWICELQEAANVTCLNEIDYISTERNILENTVLIYHAGKKAHNNIIDEGAGILNCAFGRFLEVQKLLALTRDLKTKPTVVFITETTQLCPGRNSVNHEGSELWGMLRSAVHEGFEKDIIIVDIDPEMLDVKILRRLINHKGFKDREFAISGSKLYRAIIQPQQNIDKYKRPVSISNFDKYALYSSQKGEISEPYLVLERDEISENDTELVVLQSFSVHEKSQYLQTVGKQDPSDFVLPRQTDEWQIVIVEGRGKLQKTGADVLFLHPVNATTVIKVPENNLIDIKDCPGYTSGLLILSNVLVHIESEVKDQTTVMVITQTEEVDIGQKLLLMLLDKRCCKTHFCTLQMLENGMDISQVDSLVIATPLLKKQLENIIISLPVLTTIISLNLYVQDDLHILIKHKFPNLTLRILSNIEVFSVNAIKKSMSRIKDCIQSLDYNTSNTKTNEFLIKLPISELRVQSGIDDGSLKCYCDLDNMFRSDACYILVGGLTGLGWELLQLMVEMGAGLLIPLSRRKPSDKKQQEIEHLKSKHACKICPMQADVSELQTVTRVLKDIQEKFPKYPIRGIFHGAGVIRDAVLENLDQKKIMDVMRPKIQGAWNLHVASLNITIDYFVMHSSIVSVLGNPAQCNYAAANSFLDSLSLHRRTKGLPGQSINWGALSMGMAVENDVVRSKLENNGFSCLEREKVRDLFVKALVNDVTNVIYTDLNWEKLLSVPTFSAQISKYTELHNSRTIASNTSQMKKFNLDTLSKLSMDEKTEAVKNALKGIIHEVLIVEDDALTDQTAFTDIGIDSMAAMSLTNAIEAMFKYRISVFNILSEETTLLKVVESILQNIETSESSDKHIDENIDNNLDARKLFASENITFMQMDLQTTYFHNRDDPYLLNVIDLEMFKMKFHLDEWKKILQHVLKLHPGLRRKYRFTGESDVSVETVSEDALEIDIASVSIKSLENTRLLDARMMYKPDINDSLPIFFRVAEDENSTILRIIAHTFVIDMRGISLFCKDLEKTLTTFISKQKDPPAIHSPVDVVAAVKESIFPKLKELDRFWDNYTNFDIKPVTLGNNLRVVDVNSCCLSHLNIKTRDVHSIKKYVAKLGISVYHFFMSLYHLYLYIGSKSSLVPVGTAVDMRFHVPKLSSVITRCANFIPVIAHINATKTMTDFIKGNSEQIMTTTENGAYPSSLIVKKIRSADARKNIFRHFLAMNDLTAVNKLDKDEDRPRAEIKRVWHVRPDRETFVYVSHDLSNSWIKLETGHNSNLCSNFGDQLPEKLLWLAHEAIDNGHKTIEQLRTEMKRTLIGDKPIVREKNAMEESKPTNHSNLRIWRSYNIHRSLPEHHSINNDGMYLQKLSYIYSKICFNG